MPPLPPARQWLATLEQYAFPLIGDRPVGEVARADVVAVLSPIWLATPETARRVLQRIDRVMRWAVGQDHRAARIDMDLVRDALPKQPRRRSTVRRMPSVPWRDASAFYAALAHSRTTPATRQALAFLMLTASRPGNVALAKRGQVNIDRALWSIPGQEMKVGEPHVVPLSAEALALATAAMDAHDGDLVFTAGVGPLSPDTLRMAMRRMGRMETPHGFRSTFKEWARAHGWRDELSELALAHLDRDDVRAAYARDTLVEERRPMMDAWAAFLAGRPHSPAAPGPE